MNVRVSWSRVCLLMMQSNLSHDSVRLPIAQIVTTYGVRQQQYADDTQLYISISRNNTFQLHDLEDCLLSLFSWFSHNGLSLNSEKTNAVLFGTYQSAKSLSNTSNSNVAGTSVALSDKVKLLSIMFDRHLTFDSHIVQVCRLAHFQTRVLRHIRMLFLMIR